MPEIRQLSRTDQLKQKKREEQKHKIKKIGLLFLFLVLITIGFFSIPFFLIKKITINELPTLDNTEIQTYIQNSLSGRYFFVLPKKNVFLIHKKSLIQSIQKTYPAINTIQLKKDFTSLSFIITERAPATVWCRLIEEKNSCYFVNDEGLIFEKAGVFSNPLFFVFYTQVESTDPTGKTVLSPERFIRVKKIQETLLSYGIKIYGYKAEKNGDELFFIRPIILGNKDTVYVKTDENQSSETITSKLVTAFKSKRLQDEKKNNFSNLKYIDVRFTNQVNFMSK